MTRAFRTIAALAALVLCGAADEPPSPAAAPPLPTYGPQSYYVVRYDHWTPADERGFGEFITGIGDSGCRTVDACLRGPGNPFRASDPDGIYFRSDCADLPYVLRFYYAWKRGLPFAYVSVVEPRGHTRDIRYTARGNAVTERTTIAGGETSGYALIDTLRDAVSSATYRVHPDLEEPLEQDLYSPAIQPGSIRPGTVIYDPNGHLATVYRVDPDGRIHYIDAHPDNALTRGFYDLRFVRSSPGMGAGFKNWRPVSLVDALRKPDGTYVGGHVVVPPNKAIPDFSDEQFFGNGARPNDDRDWRSGTFTLNKEPLDYYDFVRARLAGGNLSFDPLKEVHDMVESNCADLHYRADAVTLAIAAGLTNMAQPDHLPPNIYGTEGDWETFSTPSRDARLKTAFKELRDMAARFMAMYQSGDSKLKYAGQSLAVDMLTTYDRTAAACKLSYVRSDGSQVNFGYEDARKRLFAMSFDPYHCIERRWGATDPRELSTCRDGPGKQAWYAAEQDLRNQIERAYDVEMDFSLDELVAHAAGSGVAAPPDTDVRTYLWQMRGAVRGTPKRK
ncbi:MAG TPA: hypothetical protein VJ476_12105 [Rhizomicrobium sp.]|nr:hypothetical protein [Rhizomicrobium sp.]